MLRKRMMVGLLVVFVVLGLFVAHIEAQTKTPVRVGLITEQTGAASMSGERGIRATRLAEKQMNAAGGVNGTPVEVIVYDNNSTTQGTVNAVNKAIEDKVIALSGPGRSTHTQAAAPIIKENAIPALIASTAVQLTKQGNPWLFRMRPDDSIYGTAMAEFLMKDLKLTKVGILHDADAFGTGGADIVTETMKKNNLSPVRRERYTVGTKDYTAQLLNIKNAGAEGVVLYTTNSEDAAVIFRQIRELGINWKIVGCPAAVSQVVIDLSKDASEAAYGAVDYFTGANPQSKAFREAYLKEYNQEPDFLAAYPYETLVFLVNVMKRAGTTTDRNKIRETILATKGYKGVMGTYNFTPNGDGIHEINLVQMKGGKLQYIRTISVGQR
jgi:branched-chain amino acid transport system substrate-binding protein